MNKSGSAVLGVVAIILALIILTIYLVGLAQRDCNSNKDCPDSAYCGTDYECHEYPNQIVVEKNNLLWPAVILGVALIAAAYLFRGGKLPWEKKK